MISKKLNLRHWGSFVFLCAPMFGLTGLASPALEEEFSAPPEKANVETWYHFTGTLATKSGVTADFEAMRDMGIKAAHIFAVGSYYKVPNGNLDFAGESWREIVRHMGVEAKRCGISLGTHNCPGWSSSGGPWIKPEDSMKMVVGSEIYLKGPFDGKVTLPQPKTNAGYYKDIALLAVPSGEPMPSPKIKSDIPGISNALKGKKVRIPIAKEGSKPYVVFEFDSPYSARGARLQFPDRRLFVSVTVSVSDDGKNYKKLAKKTYRGTMDIGAIKTIPFGREVAFGKFYKFEFEQSKRFAHISPLDANLTLIDLVPNSIVDSVQDKASLSKKFQYFPPSKKNKNIPGFDTGKIVRIESPISDKGETDISLPEGNWMVLRIGATSTGAKNLPSTCRGLECDKLSKKGMDAHWPNYMQKMIDDLGGSLASATIDSYEVGGQNWTEDFAEEFKARRGYDITPWLPAMLGYVVGDESKTAKFLFDLGRTVSELYAENYYDYFCQLCKNNGLQSIIEPYWGNFDHMRMIRHADFPVSEFWMKGVPTMRPPTKAIGSAANVYGKSRAGTESFTSRSEDAVWVHSPRTFRITGDQAWSRGVSELVLHTYVHQPLEAAPGFSLGKHGSHFNRLNTWWKMSKPWFEYVGRSQALLQRGKAVCEILFVPPFHNPNALWNTLGTKASILSAGYDYDICSATDLGETMFVENGKVKASKEGQSYDLLVLDSNKYISVDKLKALEQLISDGAIVLAGKPLDTPTLSDNPEEFKEIVSRIWEKGKKSKKIGKGKIFYSGSPTSILKKMGVSPHCSPCGMEILARTDGKNNIFFVRNPYALKANATLAFFKQEGKIPQLWCAKSGKISDIARYSREGDKVKIPMEFDSFESKFIVFVDGNENKHVEDMNSPKEESKKGEIIEARYGVLEKNILRDVTDTVSKKAEEGFVVSNEELGGDPAPLMRKKLFVKYSQGKEICSAEIPEGSSFILRPDGTANLPGVRPVNNNGKLFLKFDINSSSSGTLSDGKKFSVSVSDLPNPVDISSDWKLSLPGVKSSPIHLDKLSSLSEMKDADTKYFSGTMEYSKTVDIPRLPKDILATLSFDEICDIAEVEINGKKVCSLWTSPNECDITEFLKEGENSIVVKVANTWANRLIGDQRYPEEKYPKWVLEGKSKSETKRVSWSAWGDPQSKDSPLRKSGLVGQAKIKFSKLVPLP